MLGTQSTLLALHPSGILSFSSLTGDLPIVWLSPPGSQLLVVSSSLNTLFEFFQKDFIYWTSISWCIRAVCSLLCLNPLSVTARHSAAAREARLWPVGLFPQQGIVLAVIRTSDESKQPFWLVQLFFEGSSYAVSSVKVWAGAELQHVSSSLVAAAVPFALDRDTLAKEELVLGIYSKGCGVKATQAATLKYLVHWT